MKRLFSILILIAVSAAAAFAQISDTDALKMKTIAQKSASVKTLFCKFKQVQESPLLENADVSTGQMQYLSSGKLVWKYETPKLYQLSMLEDKVVITSDKGTKVTQLSDSPMMSQMRSLIFSIISGDQLLQGENRFDCKVAENGGQTIVTMIPKIRQLKKAFSSMEFTFKGSDYVISKVVLSAPDGGKTTVTFTEQKIER